MELAKGPLSTFLRRQPPLTRNRSRLVEDNSPHLLRPGLADADELLDRVGVE